MTAQPMDNGSFKEQLRDVASRLAPVSEEAEVMARALFSLQFADRWLAEQVEEREVTMRGTRDHHRSRHELHGRHVEVVIEPGVERRLIGAVEPPALGWALIRVGTHRDLLRISDDGTFTAVVPDVDGPIDIVLEFDEGTTLIIRDLGD